MKRKLDADTLISVVAPVFNEAENIRAFVDEVISSLDALDMPSKYEIVLCNDGSTDRTGGELDALAAEHPQTLRVIHLARNFGLWSAICAGLEQARGDAIIVMDSDMQDDPAAFRSFLDKWQEGYDVVYAVRATRQEGTVSRLLFWGFYRLLSWAANIDMPLDAGNFALMDRRVVDALAGLPERNLYFPGLRTWVGFGQTGVEVARRARYDKKPRVGLRGQWTLAMNAIFSFSYVPLFFLRFAGVLAILMAGGLMAYAIIAKFLDMAVIAWASQLVAISFFGGINLLGIGILGEYIARIYDEVKQRPRYVVARIEEDAGPGEGA